MGIILFIIGFIWALPITLVSLIFHIIPLWALGHYCYAGWTGLAFRFNVKPKINRFLGNQVHNHWSGWSGHALGNTIVMRSNRKTTLIHEHEHVIQCMRLGIFMPIFYVLYWLIAKFGVRNLHPYYDNPFEIDARRKAGQLIDITGASQRLLKATQNFKSNVRD